MNLNSWINNNWRTKMNPISHSYIKPWLPFKRARTFRNPDPRSLVSVLSWKNLSIRRYKMTWFLSKILFLTANLPLLKEILKEIDDHTHEEYHKTLHCVGANLYGNWEAMRTDVQKHVQTYVTCQNTTLNNFCPQVAYQLYQFSLNFWKIC